MGERSPRFSLRICLGEPHFHSLNANFMFWPAVRIWDFIPGGKKPETTPLVPYSSWFTPLWCPPRCLPHVAPYSCHSEIGCDHSGWGQSFPSCLQLWQGATSQHKSQVLEDEADGEEAARPEKLPPCGPLVQTSWSSWLHTEEHGARRSGHLEEHGQGRGTGSRNPETTASSRARVLNKWFSTILQVAGE